MFTRRSSTGGKLGGHNFDQKEEAVPQIIVLADSARQLGEAAVMLRERVSLTDLESDHFAAQLVERLGWAVGDAHEVEREVVANGARPAS
jgi:hypothetical protein